MIKNPAISASRPSPAAGTRSIASANQFGAKVVGAFLKVDAGDVWVRYCDLRPMTVGEQLASLLNEAEFRDVHAALHRRLRLAGRVSYAWAELSHANHHAYELSPSATELRLWLDDCEGFYKYASLLPQPG